MNKLVLTKPVYDALAHFIGCGCGDPDSAYEALREHLSKHISITDHDDETAWNESVTWRYEWLDAHKGYGWLLLYALEVAGLTEHGSNISTGWLTDLGREVLKFLDEAAAVSPTDLSEAIEDAKEEYWKVVDAKVVDAKVVDYVTGVKASPEMAADAKVEAESERINAKILWSFAAP